MQGTLLERIDEEIERQSLLKHRFYQSWAEGKLTREELAGYAMEYYQLVKCVPDMVQTIIHFSRSDDNEKQEMKANLEDEKSHIALWERFASSLGVSINELIEYSGTEDTRAAVSKLLNLTMRSPDEAFSSMYAYEKEIPRISRSKIDGLKKFYGLDGKDATSYFETHEIDDVRHAAVWRMKLLNVPDERQERVYMAAVESLKAQNELLDSVMKKYCQNN